MAANTLPVRERLAIALDTNDLERATLLAKAVQPHIAVAKVGLELFSAAGREAVMVMRELGMTIFLDVKLHDIPNTVGGAATVLGGLGVHFLTLHATGGEAMLRAGVLGLADGAAAAGLPTPLALAVTVLTSERAAPVDLLRQRVATAVAAECPGVVCAAGDLQEVKGQAPDIFAVTPGIRPAGVPSHDQGRVASPAEAIKGGADLLVIGRAVTGSSDPGAAAASIAEEVASALP